MEEPSNSSSGAKTNGTNGVNQSSPSTVAPASATWPRPNPNPDRQSNPNTAPRSGVVQPKPQALPKRSGPGSIIVSPRQKGNPVLSSIRSVPWEYGDIPADYVLGLTTCALFLSLKYHRLHPEYIYTRIKGLQGKYALRIVLVMVDIQNHEESLRELSKTSLINNVTLILCWSSLEGGRYLELFKQYENSSPTAIRQHQSNAYSDRMVDFITTPRSINKTDAVSLVSQFGTMRTAVNARHEDVAGIAGWGEKKVERWCKGVREPFRVQRAAKRGISREVTMESLPASTAGSESREQSQSPSAAGANGGKIGQSPLRRSVSVADTLPVSADADKRPSSRLAEEVPLGPDEALAASESAAAEVGRASSASSKQQVETTRSPPQKRKPEDDPLSEGVMAALSKLRKGNG